VGDDGGHVVEGPEAADVGGAVEEGGAEGGGEAGVGGGGEGREGVAEAGFEEVEGREDAGVFV
jgi:hypothetical protein